MNKKIIMKTSSALVMFAAAVLSPSSLTAQVVFTPVTPVPLNAVSETAGATLLVPYFEVDLNNPNGKNTIFTIDHTGRLDYISINGGPNQSNFNVATATLAHVTIWSDLAVPVFNFDVYLTGYDVEVINMRNVLNGTLPQTASAGQDPMDTISPKGPLSQDINFASCSGLLPPAKLTLAQISDLGMALTGNSIPGQNSQCAGLNHGDKIARGYVTVDISNSCSNQNPGDSGYFSPGGSGRVTAQNHYTGEVFYVDPSNSITRGGNLVFIHADFSDPITSTSGNYTFYGRLDGFNASDGRQPLATTFAARFNPGATSPSTPQSSLIVWRDPKVPQSYFTCGMNPTWYPLGQEGITAFDEQEHPLRFPGLTPFPAATQLVPMGGSSLPVTFTAGWLWLDLNTNVAGTVGPTADIGASQAWVQIIDGAFGVMHNAQALDNATAATHVTP